ncbi:putative metal-dependent hydrolase [Pullulanibacillus pueri]|uniref:YgjP-like metallopeptidase domain-containing protein n=1 Tax=Pullulanibacillus pueri TaxID=1437324 RepID=A0A8J2ZR25_9BACL|nr:SprT family zinc-dependent metalloprotease [Pullulanibacillus pueri]MBM7679882.1 putative metal-dependent hydrolase [Pullulanibacillus pueri]GGH73302.1 hypothetical protein GCM10007096_00410 [Pullulanibacillus pueri]
MAIFKYGLTEIEYELMLHDRDDIIISVDWINGLEVKAPGEVEKDRLEAVLHKKAKWIMNKYNEIYDIVKTPLPKEFVSGEKFSYLGRAYRLKVLKKEHTKVDLTFHQGKFIATVPTSLSERERQDKLKKAFKKWYNQHGLEKVKQRLALYTEKLGVQPLSITLRDQRLRWGTCTPEGNIYLNWRLVMAPIPVIDYVIVHELSHLKHMNHSKDYWAVVRTLLPNYEQHKEWLKNNGPLLTL